MNGEEHKQPIHDFYGQRFGKLLVTRMDGPLCVALCDCGSVVHLEPTWLLERKHTATASCGCYTSKSEGDFKTKHGLATSRAYHAWRQMINSCYKPTSTLYKKMGGAGISVCDRWRESVENFAEDMGQPPKDHTLDRYDIYGDFEPSNCFWNHKKATRRRAWAMRRVTYRGVTKTLEEWCDEMKLKGTLAHYYLNAGATPEEAFEKTAKGSTYARIRNPADYNGNSKSRWKQDRRRPRKRWKPRKNNGEVE